MSVRDDSTLTPDAVLDAVEQTLDEVLDVHLIVRFIRNNRDAILERARAGERAEEA